MNAATNPTTDDPETMPTADQLHERPPFPAWLRELCYFGGLIVALTVFGLNLQSDQRSLREEMVRMSTDMAAIRQSLPNKEVYDKALRDMEKRQDNFEVKMETYELKQQSLRERLMRQRVID
jgi:hypothetical protein